MKENYNGFSPVSSTPVLWKSRKRSGSFKNVDKSRINVNDTIPEKPDESLGRGTNNLETDGQNHEKSPLEETNHEDPVNNIVLSEKRKALFEPLEPVHNINGKRLSAESLLPPPDFESAIYPRGWLIGKKRKLVNVDVVESMRRIAVQEMNRKDREIDGLNEQLEEDARCLEHLQTQLLEERSKRVNVERENSMLQNQINMMMDMIQENEAMDDQGTEDL